MKRFRGALLLTLTALIWGTAFVAQSLGMDHLGPFTFNGVRNFVAALGLLPVILFLRRRQGEEGTDGAAPRSRKTLWLGGALCGLALGVASSLQQIGIQYTTVGKAGFLTALYIVIVPLLGLLFIAILEKFKVKGSVLISIVVVSILYYVLSGTVPAFDMSQVGETFKDFSTVGITGVFQGDAWSRAFTGEEIGGVFSAIMLIITFCLVDMFDTIGTLYGTASQADMLDKDGDPINVNECMTSDSIATVAGAVCGTSTCTTFVESAAGVGAGGRTGLTSLVVAICFAVCLFLSPLASLVPACATAPALIYVGVLMLKGFAKVDMSDLRSAVPAFLALVMMPMTYSISNGIGIGAIAYVLITLFTGKYQKKDVPITVIAALFVVKFIFVTM